MIGSRQQRTDSSRNRNRRLRWAWKLMEILTVF